MIWEDIMKLPHRRQFLRLAAGAVALPVMTRMARAQAYPSRPVRIVVGFGAGCTPDMIARVIGQGLSERLGQSFVIENRAGAGSNMGIQAVVRAAADGYTLLLVTSTNALSATLYDSLDFSLLRDIAPVASIYRVPVVLVVHPSVPANTVSELIAHAKANPGKLNFASSGTGNLTHVSGELFKMLTGTDMVHIPYRGGTAPAQTDLLSGRVQIMFDTIPALIGHINTGALRALAVASATPSEALPNVPAGSQIVRGFEASGWYGIGAPSKVSSEIVDRLNREINATLQDPKLKIRFADLGGISLGGSPIEFGKFISDETEKWSKVIRAANIKAE
jgi:tripartite-type tricarboxylate transporter receptor subunit TctC